MLENSLNQIRSNISSDGVLSINIHSSEIPEPNEGEVLVKVEASPINPSDIGLLIGPADVSTLRIENENGVKVAKMNVPEALIRSVGARLNQSLPVGNEGAGIVEKAGKGAEEMIGKVVAVMGGAMYSNYRCVPISSCLIMNEGTNPKESASCFVNPLTALGMVETMKMENHSAIVHTAAASNLGQMLLKICNQDAIRLVNIVRKEEHVSMLKNLGAEYVCNSSEDAFMENLISSLVDTGATIGFDATGGGKLSGKILTAMEVAASQSSNEYSRYGSDTYKQVYIYGGLDRSPTTLTRAFGFSWGLGGWLLPPFLAKIGKEKTNTLRQRVVDEIKTTFSSSYTKEISLDELINEENIMQFSKQATGEKYLVTPN